jgi:hypothetical protein
LGQFRSNLYISSPNKESPTLENYTVYGDVRDRAVFISGLSMERRLRKDGLIDRAFRLEDSLIQKWIKNDNTYPEQFRDSETIVCLWGSVSRIDGRRHVTALAWDSDDGLEITTLPIGGHNDTGFDDRTPALLKA